MCTIKRINHLKTQAQVLYKKIIDADPLGTLSKKFVSGSGLTYSDLQERLEGVRDCASIIELKEQWDGNEQLFTVSAANYCKQNVICPVCADRSQSRRRAIYDDPIRQQVKLVNEGKRFVYMVSYTVTDGPSLSERLDHLKESQRNWRRMGQKRRNGTYSGGEAGKIRAGIMSTEIKRGSKSGEWHVHSHELVFTDKPLDYTVYNVSKRSELKKRYGKHIPKEILSQVALQRSLFRGEMVPTSKISDEWLRATGGDSIDISVDRLQHVPKSARGKKKLKYLKMTLEESILYQSREALKYITKPGELEPIDTIEALTSTYNRRMTATYGEFRGIKCDPYETTSTDEDETFILVWDKDDYGDPIPGKVRDIMKDEHDTRSEAGKITGEYRRKRRYAINNRNQYGDHLSTILDQLKVDYRMQINSVWSKYRRKKKAEKATVKAMCDNYNPTLAAAGYYYPDMDHRSMYAAAFN